VHQFVVGLGTQHLALLLVGAAGFEPTASRSQSERSAKLSYAPNKRLEVYPSLATAVKLAENGKRHYPLYDPNGLFATVR
jgi:hypothetical protein